MNYYERHLGDYARDTAHLSLLEHGVYTLLLDRYYASEQPIPVDQAHRVARARTPDELAAVDAVLSEFFTVQDGHYVQSRVQAEIEKARTRIETARANGRSGGRPKKNPLGFSRVIPTGTDRQPDGFSVGSILETQQKALQTPGSRLQDQILPSVVSDARENPAGTQRDIVPRGTGHRLPDDFALTADRRKVAEAEGIDPDRTFAKFCDHWRAASGSNARKRDWDAAWRNWCRTEADRSSGGTRGTTRKPFAELTEPQRQAAVTEAWDRQKARASGIGFRMPHTGEPLDSYRLKVDEAIGDHQARNRFSTARPIAELLKAGGS